jgi:hypothetical protein
LVEHIRRDEPGQKPLAKRQVVGTEDPIEDRPSPIELLTEREIVG